MGFERFSEILRQLRERHPALKQRLTEAEAVMRWEAAVGPGIGRHSRVLSVRQGVLMVQVDHPIWRSELHHRKQQILKILNDGKAGEERPIRDLFFVDPRSRRSAE